MTFRSQPVVVQVDNPPLGGTVIPLDVVQYGGSLHANVTPVANASVQILPAPPAGKCYRVHTASIAGNASGVFLEDAGAFLFFVPNNTTVVPDGQLVFGVMAYFSSAAGGFALVTYDVIQIPTIT